MNHGNLDEIRKYFEELRVLGVKPKIDLSTLQKLHKKRKFTKMFNEVRRHLGINCRFVFSRVRKGGPERSPAWIMLPMNMPQWGTDAFKELKLEVYFRNEFLYDVPLETAVFAMAHECSHVILNSTRHPLQYEERAVDLTAMMLGFAEVYCLGRIIDEFSFIKEAHGIRKFLENRGLLRPRDTMPRHYGYLTTLEAVMARSLIQVYRE